MSFVYTVWCNKDHIFYNAVFILALQVPVIKPRTLSSTRLKRIAESTDYDEFETLLAPIMKSRVPGTNGHHAVKQVLQ
jgi:hypothetical protein